MIKSISCRIPLLNIRKISIVLLPTVGVILLFWFFTTLFEAEQKVWVEKIQTQVPFTQDSEEFADWWQEKYDNGARISESYDPVEDFLSQKGITIYDSKTEFRKDLQQFCEATYCRTGYVKMYLISKKDMPELNKLGYW